MSRGRWAPGIALAGLLLLTAGDTLNRAGGNIELNSGGTIRNRYWDSRMFPIRYKLNQNVAKGYTAAAIRSTLDAAFANWETIPGINIDFEWGGTTTTNTLSTDGDYALIFNPATDPGDFVAAAPCSTLIQDVTVTDSSDGVPGNGLGRINFPGGKFITVPVGTYGPGANVDCDIMFNTFDSVFVLDGSAPNENLLGITTHESGHWHSLSHTPFPDATMFPFTDTNPPGDGGQGQGSLEADDIASTAHMYKTGTFDPAHGTLTGKITINGLPGDGAHVAALRASDLMPVAGRFSISRNFNTGDIFDGADFVAQGGGYFRLDGVPPGDYHLCAEWFDSTDEPFGRLENVYNATVGSSNIADGAVGAFAGALGFRPERFDCYNAAESANGGDGTTAGAAADNPDEATLITVTAGGVIPGLNMQVNLDPNTGKTAAARSNPTGVGRAGVGPFTRLAVLRIGTDGTDDDFFILHFPAAMLPPPPYNVIDGIWSKFGRADAAYTGLLMLSDPSNANIIEPPIVWDAPRIVSGYKGGNTGITELVDIRDRFNVTVNEPRDLYMAFKLPQSPPGISWASEGYFTVASDTRTCATGGAACTSSASCPGGSACVGNTTGRTLFTDDGFNTFFISTAFDLLYTVRTETAPPVRITSASPAVLSPGTSGNVVTIGGAGFRPGAQVQFFSPTFGPPQPSGVTVTNVTFVNSSTLQATVDVDAGAPLNFLDVEVTNPEVIIPNRARLMAVDAVDSDGDGVVDPADCLPADANVWFPPGPLGATLSASEPVPGTVQLDWSPPASPGATSVVYDVVSGDTATLLASAGGNYGTCLSAGQAGTSIQDATPLAPGEVRHYMAAGRNTCGPGTFHPEVVPTPTRDTNPGNCP